MRSRFNLDKAQPKLFDVRSDALATGFDEFEQESPFGETEVPLGRLKPPWSVASSDGSQVEQEYSLVSDIPAPGRFYKIKYGRGGLLETAGHAYGLKQGAERLTRAQAINSHPLNMKFWRPPGNASPRSGYRRRSRMSTHSWGAVSRSTVSGSRPTCVSPNWNGTKKALSIAFRQGIVST